MSFSLGKSENNANQSFNQDVWGPQGDALQGLYGNLASMFNRSSTPAYGQAYGGVDYQTDVMEDMVAPWLSQMEGGAYSDLDATDVMSSIQDSMSGPSNTQDIYSMIMGGQGNDYADAMKSSVMDDATDLMQQAANVSDMRAANYGQSGGSRHGVVMANAFEDINDAAMNQLTDIGYSTFDEDLNRKLDIASMADANTLQRQGLMVDMLGDKQNAMTGGLSFGQNMTDLGIGQQMMPWQLAQMYSSMLNTPTVLGSGSGSASGKGIGGSYSS